jgi:hypothetical protein
MALTETVRWMGRSARDRAEVMSHQMKDRALTMRLEKTTEENERLRTENRSLREAMEDSQAAHERILSLLEEHRDETELVEDGGSHRGRWFMVLMLLAGGAWAWMKRRDQGMDSMDWGGRPSDTTMGGSGASSAA